MNNSPGVVCFSSAVVTPQEFAKAVESRKSAKAAKMRGTQEILTDEQVRDRIKFLEVDNARMRAAIALRGGGREERAKVAAEQFNAASIESLANGWIHLRSRAMQSR